MNILADFSSVELFGAVDNPQGETDHFSYDPTRRLFRDSKTGEAFAVYLPKFDGIRIDLVSKIYDFHFRDALTVTRNGDISPYDWSTNEYIKRGRNVNICLGGTCHNYLLLFVYMVAHYLDY